MKTQRALRLRQAGKHHINTDNIKAWQFHWRRLSARTGIDVARHLSRAFEMNCVPKHSTEPLQEPCHTMDYVTGITTWHGRIYLHGGGIPKSLDIQDIWTMRVSETS